MTDTPDTLRRAFAPQGRLRASINVGNPILARRAEGGALPAAGVSVDLAQALAQALDLPLELVVLDSAGESVQAVSTEAADVGFFAVDPQRGERIAFTAPYVLIEGCYLVREQSALRSQDEVDRPGTRVMVGKGSAYDLYLSRSLQQAQILRAPTSPAVVQTFLDEGADVAAGVKQQLQADAQRLGGLRLLPGSFMQIRQAMGMPKSRGEAAAAYLRDFVERMKREQVGMALQRHGIQGAEVAPAGD
ncbi:transporter substrate-binding domain-containing protein [Orrella sp. JC864]|uniref:transporter substrate-binding domain-containing protein n=1 Tax=Orrella sp. JC864 TaxID=3120298 RepID=UPI0012BB5226